MLAILGLQSLAPLFPEITTEIPLTMAQMGWAIGVFNLASPVFTPIGGVLADRHGCRWVLGLGFLIMAVASGLRFYVDSAHQLIACMLLYGVGFAPIGAIVPKALSNYFPPEQIGKVNGLAFAGFGVGGAIALATAAPILSPAFGGWRASMLVFGALSFLAVLAWIIFYRDPPSATMPASHGEQSMGDSFRRVLAIRDIWLLSITYALLMLGTWTVLALLPAMLENRGVSPGLASIVMFSAIVFNVLGGVISDRIGRRKPILIVCAVALVIALPMLVDASGPLLVAALFLAGVSFGALIPVATAIPVEMKGIGPALAGTAVGVMFMIGNTGGFLGPAVSGWLIDTFHTPWAGFGFATAAAVIAVFTASQLTETGQAVQKG